MNQIEHDLRPVTRALARRLNAAVALNAALAPAAWSVGAFATALVCVKLLHPAWAVHCFWLLGAAPIAALLAILVCRRRGAFYTCADLIEMADHLYRDDGSVTASWERPGLAPEDGFAQAIGKALRGHMPRLAPGYYLRRLAPSLLYAAVAAVLPARAEAAPEPRLQAQEALVAPLAEKIELYEEFMPEDEVRELREELEAVAHDPKGVSREQWEAIEEIEKRINESAARTAQQVSDARSMLEMASGMIGEQRGGDSGAGEADPKLQEMLGKLKKLGSQPNAAMNGKLCRQLSDMAGKCSGCKPCDCKALQKQLESMCNKMSQCPGGSCQKHSLGSGRADRGPGAAPLVMGDDKQIDAVYQDQQIQTKFLALQDMVNLGVTPIEPEPDPGRFSPGTLRQFDSPGASAVSRTRISPSQRAVIQEYFERREP